MENENLSADELKQRWEAAKAREAGGRLQVKRTEPAPFETFEAPTEQYMMNKLQGYILISLGILILGLLAWSVFKPLPKYQYKIVGVQAQFIKGTADNTERGPTSVGLKDEELSLLGKEGWELVDTMLEIETTHPNYGSSEYVTGLQPNIRPQRAVLIFRKPL